MLATADGPTHFIPSGSRIETAQKLHMLDVPKNGIMVSIEYNDKNSDTVTLREWSRRATLPSYFSGSQVAVNRTDFLDCAQPIILDTLQPRSSSF